MKFEHIILDKHNGNNTETTVQGVNDYVNNRKIKMATINDSAMIIFCKIRWRVFLVSSIQRNIFD